MKTPTDLLGGTDHETAAALETEMTTVTIIETEIPGPGEMSPASVLADGVMILLI
jgi:hypothetical protein